MHLGVMQIRVAEFLWLDEESLSQNISESYLQSRELG